MRKMLLIALVLSTVLCEAEMSCDDEKCVASAQLVQTKKIARHVSNIDEIAEAMESMAKPDADNQSGKTRLLEENQQINWQPDGKVSDLPSHFYESWRNTCSGYEYHSEWCGSGCREGREIENEYTKQVCSDGKLKVIKVEKGTSCKMQDYVKFQCQATKAKIITINKKYQSSLYVKPRTDPDEIMNCGKNAAAVEMGLNDKLTGYWFDGSKNNRIWKSGNPTKIKVTVFGRKLRIYAAGDYKWGKPTPGWDTDLKLVCLPYVPMKPKVRNDQMMVPPPDLGSMRCVIPDKPCEKGKEWKIDNQKLGFATDKPTGWLCITPRNGNPSSWEPMKEQYRVRCKSPPHPPFWTKCYKNEDCHKWHWKNYGNKRDNCIAKECEAAGLKWQENEWKDCGKKSRDLWWHFKGRCA